jgi:hypothetical protein
VSRPDSEEHKRAAKEVSADAVIGLRNGPHLSFLHSCNNLQLRSRAI